MKKLLITFIMFATVTVCFSQVAEITIPEGKSHSMHVTSYLDFVNNNIIMFVNEIDILKYRLTNLEKLTKEQQTMIYTQRAMIESLEKRMFALEKKN